MGKFGELMVRDVYGNMNFDRDSAVEMPKKYTVEEYETEKQKDIEERKRSKEEGKSKTEHYLDILAK